MDKKKIVVIFIVILLVAGGVLFYLEYSKQVVSLPSTPIVPVSPSTNQSSVSSGVKQDETSRSQADYVATPGRPSNVSTQLVEVRILSVDVNNKKLTIEEKSSKTSLNLTDFTVISLVKGNTMTRIKPSEIKSGVQAKISYEPINKNIVTITIVEK